MTDEYTHIPESWQPQPTSRMCFICGRDNPVGLHLHFYEDRDAQQLMVPLRESLCDQDVCAQLTLVLSCNLFRRFRICLA